MSSNLTLYYCPGTSSLIPMVALELAGAPYTPKLINLLKGEHKTPEFLTLNPEGQVPLLSDGDHHLNQLIAIVDYLAGKYPQAGILPTQPIARARVLAMLVWFNSTLHGTFGRAFKPAGFVNDEPAQAALSHTAKAQYAALLRELESRLLSAQRAGSQWLDGDRPGILDAYALCCLRWGGMINIPASDTPHLQAQLRKLVDHPAFARVIELEHLPLP